MKKTEDPSTLVTKEKYKDLLENSEVFIISDFRHPHTYNFIIWYIIYIKNLIN